MEHLFKYYKFHHYPLSIITFTPRTNRVLIHDSANINFITRNPFRKFVSIENLHIHIIKNITKKYQFSFSFFIKFSLTRTRNTNIQYNQISLNIFIFYPIIYLPTKINF